MKKFLALLAVAVGLQAQITTLPAAASGPGGGTGDAAEVVTTTCSGASATFTGTSNTVPAFECLLVATNVTSSTLASLTDGQLGTITITQPGGGGITVAAITGMVGDVAITGTLGTAAAEVCIKLFRATSTTTADLLFMTCSLSGTLVTKTGAETLTNKTLTSPVITTPTGLPSTSCTAPTIMTALSSALAGTCTAPILTQNSQSAAYTTVIGDAGKSLYHPSADTTARTWTIDSNANVAYTVGTCITFINDTSAGVLTIAITSDTMILAGAGTTGSRTLAANGVATACKMTSTRWIINGSGLT
jgi:hypothetical protein